MASNRPFPFLDLPLELRESIYSLYFKPADRLVQTHGLEAQGFFGGVYKFDLDVYRVNKQVYREAQAVWRRENVFVKIATPWPSAGMYRVYLMSTDGRDLPDFGAGGKLNHISSEGLVPIVCTDARADSFTTHHSLVQITAPFHQAVPEHTVVVLLDDLHLFTQTWYYSALSYPMLNDRLSTTFKLRDPYKSTKKTEGTGEKEISIALQKRLLLPFEQVKGLHQISVLNYAPSVRTDLERLMAIPVPSLTQCVETSTSLLEAGDAALAAKRPAEALDLFKRAFHAIHILIHGRTRRVLADIFFHEGISTGRYAGQTGMTARIVLRLKLVARFVLTYLRLEQWAEAAFWGMRSIRILRESMDSEFEDFLSELIGGEDVGLIYVRTGVAFWKMEQERQKWTDELGSYEDEDLSGSGSIWSVAGRYLKGCRKGVREELREFRVGEEIVVANFGDVDGSSTTGVDGSGEE